MLRVVVVGAMTKLLEPAKLAEIFISLAVSVVAPNPLTAAPKLIAPVPARTVKVLAAPVTAPFILMSALTSAVLSDTPAVRETPVPASPRVICPPAVNAPARDRLLGAVTVKLPPKTKVSAELFPNTNVPVFINSRLFVIELLEPVKLTPYGFAVVVNVGVLSPPSNEIIAALLVFRSTTLVLVLTEPINRVPPECVTVKDDSAVVDPIAPST